MTTMRSISTATIPLIEYTEMKKELQGYRDKLCKVIRYQSYNEGQTLFFTENEIIESLIIENKQILFDYEKLKQSFNVVKIELDNMRNPNIFIKELQDKYNELETENAKLKYQNDVMRALKDVPIDLWNRYAESKYEKILKLTLFQLIRSYFQKFTNIK